MSEVVETNIYLKCTSCKINQSPCNFNKNYLTTSTKYCKSCYKKRNNDYYQKNKEQIKSRVSDYNSNNKDIISVRKKEFYEQNKELVTERNKNYRKNNLQKVKDIQKEYRENNKDTLKIYFKNHKKNKNEKYKKIAREYSKRKREDGCFKLKQNISKSIYKMLKRQCSSKRRYKTIDYVSWTLKELKSHIEYHFCLPGNEWMNWKNQGKFYENVWNDDDQSTWVWNLDHIVPHSIFKYTSMEDEEFKKCWSLENLRPYSAKQNILDGNRR